MPKKRKHLRMPKPTTVKVKRTYHNAFAIWMSEPLEDGKIWSEVSRPQDWGNPKWSYRWYKIEDEEYIFIFHVWIDIPDYDRGKHYKTFLQMAHLRMMPGQPKELCDRSHLKYDDFWEKSWGEMPPHYKNEEGDVW